MRGRLRRIAFAGAIATAACNAIVGNEAIRYVTDDGGSSGGIGIDGGDGGDAAVTDAGDAAVTDAGDAGPIVVLVPPCSAVDAAFCADFDPPASAPIYGFGSAMGPAMTTSAAAFTTMPYSLRATANSGQVDRRLAVNFSNPVTGRWELDLRILDAPRPKTVGGGTPSATLLRLRCNATERVRVRLVNTELVLDVITDTGTVAATAPGPTLPLATWRHLAVDLGSTTATLTTNGTSPAVLARSCAISTSVDLGLLDNADVGATNGQWDLLFDSFRFYP